MALSTQLVPPAQMLDVYFGGRSGRRSIEGLAAGLDPSDRVAACSMTGFGGSNALLVTMREIRHYVKAGINNELQWSLPVAGATVQKFGYILTISASDDSVTHRIRVSSGASEIVAAINHCSLGQVATNSQMHVATVGYAQGVQLLEGERVGMKFEQDRFSLCDPASNGPLVVVLAADLREFSVGGPGAVTEGGGFIGLGVRGWTEAGLLNSLTERNRIETHIRVSTLEWTVTLVSENLTPAEAEAMAPVVGATAGEAATRRQDSLSDELTRLAELHRGGVLSDGEFQSAKSRLLGNG